MARTASASFIVVMCLASCIIAAAARPAPLKPSLLTQARSLLGEKALPINSRAEMGLSPMFMVSGNPMLVPAGYANPAFARDNTYLGDAYNPAAQAMRAAAYSRDIAYWGRRRH